MPPSIKVGTTSLTYDRLHKWWQLVEDVLGGTSRFRERAQTYLPREDKEKPTDYNVRLNRSFLDPAYEDVIEKLVGKPFSKPITITPNFTDENFLIVQKNADRQGSTLTAFTRELFETGINYGLVHLLVDHTFVPEGLNRQQEERLGARAYLVNVTPSELWYWKSEIINGEKTLVEIHIHSTEIEIVGGREKEVDVITIWYPGSIEKYKKTEEGYIRVSETENTLGRIPLVTAYFDFEGYMQAKPVLFKLAEMLTEHWAVSSDRKNILRAASRGILFGSGFSEQQVKEGLTIGINNAVLTTNPDAKMMYVEYQGRALEAIMKSINNIEERMDELGHQPFISSPGRVTATRDLITDTKNEAPIKTWINATNELLEAGFDLVADWRKIDRPTNEIRLFDEFILFNRVVEDVQHLRAMRKDGDISRETYWEELKKRRVLSERFDSEQENERLDAEIDAGGLLDDSTFDQSASA